MTKKIHGGIEKGIWVERDVAFVTLTFSADVSDSAFGIPNSCLDNAIQKLIQRKAIVLGVSDLYSSGTKVDVMLGHAAGWYSATNNGVIFTGEVVDGLEADLETVVAANASAAFAKFEALPAATAGDLTEFDGKFWMSI